MREYELYLETDEEIPSSLGSYCAKDFKSAVLAWALSGISRENLDRFNSENLTYDGYLIFTTQNESLKWGYSVRLIIAGGRDFNDYSLLCDETSKFIGEEKNVTIISGLARGADRLGCRFAEENNYTLEGFAAQWKLPNGVYDHSAGIKRNKLMAKNADSLIAFWDGDSRGTMSMIDFAAEMGLNIKVVEYGWYGE